MAACMLGSSLLCFTDRTHVRVYRMQRGHTSHRNVRELRIGFLVSVSVGVCVGVAIRVGGP